MCETINSNFHAKVWGFEMIDGQRRYVRRTLMSDTKGDYRTGRLVYHFVDRKSD